MATFTITIAGVDRSANVKVETVDVTVSLDRGGSMAGFTIFDTATKTGAASIRPIERQEVSIVYDGVTIFGGQISSILTRQEDDLLYYDVMLQSWDQVLDAIANNQIVSFVGTSGQQNVAKRLYHYDDADEMIRLVSARVPAAWAISASKVAAGGKVNTYRTSTYKLAKSTSAKTGRRVHDYTTGTLGQSFDKVARVGGGRWWVDASKVLNYKKARSNLVGTNYDVEAGTPLTTAATWVRTTNKGPAGTDDYALVTSTATSTGYFDVAATAGKRYYFAAHGYATTASNLFVEVLFLDAAKTTTLGTTTITYTDAATWKFKSTIATAPASTAYVRMRVRSGATATENRVDNLILVEEDAPFGVADAPGSGEIAPLVYVNPSDFPSPINYVYVKGKNTAGSGVRKDMFSIGYFGAAYTAVVEDAKSEDSGDVDVAANDVLNARAFPEKSVGYKVRWDATTKTLAVGQLQFENWTALGKSDVGLVSAIHYTWTSNAICMIDVALGAPGNSLGILLGKVKTAAVGPAELRGSNPMEVRPPSAAASAPQVDTTATKPVVNTLGSFSSGFGPASVSQRASTTLPVDDTLPDLPAPELPAGSLYALFPAAGDTVLTRATLYRVSDDGLTWSAATSATLTADAVASGSTGAVLIGDQIVAGTLDANSVNVTNINATNITTGTLTSIAINSGTGRFTVDASGNATANALTIGATTSDTVGNDTTGRIAIVPASTQSAASFQVQDDTAGNLYKSANLLSATAGSSTSDSTVTTELAHGFVVGQFVSFHGTGNSVWNAITASLPVQIKATPTATTFTIRPSTALVALASNNAGTVRAYKRLNIVAPGGVFVYQSGTGTPTPGVLGSGSLVLGASMTDLGEGGLATLADGEIGFLTATTPRYGGGANLYSSDGTATVNTSGMFEAGSHITGARVIANEYFYTYDGRIYLRGIAANPSVIFRNSANADVGTISHNLTNFTMNDSVSVTGAVTASASVTGTIITATSVFYNDTPATTGTSPTTSGRGAVWTLTGGTNYRLDRYVAPSSGELKKNIVPTTVAPEQVYALDLVEFEYDLDKIAERYPNVNVAEEGTRQGVIWEQVADVMPQAAIPGNETDPVSIDWESLYFGALVAIQDLNERLKIVEEALKAKE